jgi:hypothetical protein
MHWAHKRGLGGLALYARDAIDIGSAVRAMADLDLKGAPIGKSRAAMPANLCSTICRHLVAMAAHAQLWNENNPGRLIEAFHWIGLPKDGGEFQHQRLRRPERPVADSPVLLGLLAPGERPRP